MFTKFYHRNYGVVKKKSKKYENNSKKFVQKLFTFVIYAVILEMYPVGNNSIV